MKKLLSVLIIIISIPCYSQDSIGTYHSGYGKVYQVYYDSVKGKAYYNRTKNAKFYFNKNVTDKFLKQ